MAEFFGQENQLLLIHGGAGPQDPSADGILRSTKSLKSIGLKCIKRLNAGDSLLTVATYCLRQLESNPLFNAGVGSALQADGIARLSASLMDGRRQSFSGVVSISYVSHPSDLALVLQNKKARVLTSPGAELMARELNLPVATNITDKRSKRWLKKLEDENYNFYDTVGCVLLQDNILVAGSSTGGRGFEFPGRVSDSSTPAGNYASKFAAITTTGMGEQIIDDGLAVRLETRIRDGMSVKEASYRCFKEAQFRKRRYGWLVVDKKGEWGVVHTTPNMPFVVFSGKNLIASS